MKPPSRKWIPGSPKIKRWFLAPKGETVGVGRVPAQSKVIENSGTVRASPSQVDSWLMLMVGWLELRPWKTNYNSFSCVLWMLVVDWLRLGLVRLMLVFD